MRFPYDYDEEKLEGDIAIRGTSVTISLDKSTHNGHVITNTTVQKIFETLKKQFGQEKEFNFELNPVPPENWKEDELKKD